MGILDDVLGQVVRAAGGGKDQLSDTLASLLGGGTAGGLSGLVESFTRNGLGDIVGSWVGTGKNLPITAEQIMKGLGEERVQKLASLTGMKAEQIASLAAQMLPGIVDRLTPDGKIPADDLLQKGLDLLRKG